MQPFVDQFLGHPVRGVRGNNDDIGFAAGFARSQADLQGDGRHPVDDILGGGPAQVRDPDADILLPAGDAPVPVGGRDLIHKLADHGALRPGYDFDVPDCDGRGVSGRLLGHVGRRNGGGYGLGEGRPEQGGNNEREHFRGPQGCRGC